MIAALCRMLTRCYRREFGPERAEEMIDVIAQRLSDVRRVDGTVAAWRLGIKEVAIVAAGIVLHRLGRRSGHAGRRRPSHPRRDAAILALFDDVRYAGRSFRKYPTYSAIVVLTLGLGIGANTAIFSVVNGVLLRPLPYRDPGQLALIWDRYDWLGDARSWVHDLQIRSLREQSTSFEGLAAVRMVSGRILGGDRPVHTNVARVSANFFDLLGVEPAMGRAFKEGDDVWGAPWTVILTHGFWQREFGGDPNIIGKTLTVGFPPMEVIGVLPAEFDYRVYEAIGEPIKPDLWIPHQIDYGWWNGPVAGSGVALLARIADGVTFEQAQDELTTLGAREDETNFGGAGFTYELVPLIGDMVNPIRPALLLLIGAVGFVLLIAIANITTLALARTQYRAAELAVRHSLGASRWRITRQLVTENLFLAAAGAGVGLALAFWGIDLLVSFAPVELPRTDSVDIDVAVLGFTALLTIGAGTVPGLVPAMHLANTELAAAVREGGRVTETRGARRTRNGLVILEFAMSVVLLAGSGLMVRSFVRLQQVDPGFDPDRVLTFSVYLMQEYDSTERQNAFFSQVAAGIGALPGVVHVGSTSALPLNTPSYGPVFTVQQQDSVSFFLTPGIGFEPDPGYRAGEWVLADLTAVRPGYFRAAGIPLFQGREFAETDHGDAAPTVVIDEKLADALWPGEPAVGRRVWIFNTWRTVVGVAQHTHHAAYGIEGRPQLYFPYAQVRSGRVSMVVRSSGDPNDLVPAIREVVGSVDPLVPIADIRTMDEIVAESVAQRRFMMLLMTAFAGAAILLAALGICGVLQFSVGQRRKEIAVRLAIGSSPRDVARLVIRHGMGLAGTGMALGLGAAVLMGAAVESMLFDVHPNDPVSLTGAGLLIALVALIACWIPARRATSVDPASTLRTE